MPRSTLLFTYNHEVATYGVGRACSDTGHEGVQATEITAHMRLLVLSSSFIVYTSLQNHYH